jgi:DNA-binding XRE family transcriptional regulator
MRRSNVAGMEATQNSDASPAQSDVKVRLRMEVYDALAEKREVTTVVAQAKLHGIGRQHMFRIRSGRWQPSLPVAMRMAADLGTTVDALFERVA